jgi:sialic acid synthase SpsE
VKFRRTLYFVKSAIKGDGFTEELVKSIRPGFGIAPKYLQEVLVKPLLQDVEPGQAVIKNL